jgi:hypothetical protein
MFFNISNEQKTKFSFLILLFVSLFCTLQITKVQATPPEEWPIEELREDELPRTLLIKGFTRTVKENYVQKALLHYLIEKYHVVPLTIAQLLRYDELFKIVFKTPEDVPKDLIGKTIQLRRNAITFFIPYRYRLKLEQQAQTKSKSSNSTTNTKSSSNEQQNHKQTQPHPQEQKQPQPNVSETSQDKVQQQKTTEQIIEIDSKKRKFSEISSSSEKLQISSFESLPTSNVVISSSTSTSMLFQTPLTQML